MDIATAAQVVHYLCPAVIFLYLLLVAVLKRCSPASKESPGESARDLFKQCLIIFLVLTYVAETAVVVIKVFSADIDADPDLSVFLLGCLLAWLFLLSRCSDHTHEHLVPAAITATGEIALAVTIIHTGLNSAERVTLLVAHLLRAISAAALLLLALFLYASKPSGTKDETEPLLGSENGVSINGAANGTANGEYGAVKSADTPPEEEDRDKDLKERAKKRYQESQSWYSYISDYFIFVPMLMPKGNRKVQAMGVLVLCCLAADRALNLLVPRQVGIVANKLAATWGLGPSHAPFMEAAVLAIMSWLQGSGGVSVIQDLAMIPIEQFSYRQVTQSAFNHVMSLSVDFHIDQNSGELMKALDQGRSLTDILRVLLLDLGPTLVDVFIGLGYLYFVFGVNACITIILAGLGFFWIDQKCTNWIMPRRRKYISKIRTEYKVMHEAVQGWQTVTYFNRLNYENGRMAVAIKEHQQVQAEYSVRKNFIALFRGLAVDLGFLCMLMLAVLRISRGQTDVGSFVTLYAYWPVLISPLNIFGGYYRWLSRMLIDAERLLELFRMSPTVTDAVGARALQVTQGAITLKDVHFAYDVRKETIKGIDVDVAPGTTVAFVGETGAGKSTLLKLLYRLYDITAGEIAIDGQSISSVTLSSLRESMGVVPQDPMLFNDTLMVNLRYARLDATDEEIYEACKAARIHDKIVTFPDGYRSKVGERGVKLSGGELQRVAIARVLLKRPKIVLLDEATSSIDTETEQQVQEAFNKLSEGRTTLVIAHRLSTIVKADMIVVLEEGEIIEQGTHQSLLELDGKYARLWSKQIAQL